MTAPDTNAIRAQMEALEGFTPGPWNADLGETYRVRADGMNIATANFVTLLDRIPTDQVRQNARLIASAPDMHATIFALCDALDELRAENERLQAIIDNLHAVEEKYRETANADFHRANRLQAENERLRADREQGGKDYCNMMDQRDAQHVYAKKLEAALRPFVEYVHDDFRRGKATYELVATDRAGGGLIGAEDLRRARAALAQKGGE